MFVNHTLFRYVNVASIFICIFGMLECCSLHFNRKNGQISQETVNFSAAKATKIITILDLLLTSAKRFVKFQCFRKKDNKKYAFPPKH